jgi:hypothetical protein
LFFQYVGTWYEMYRTHNADEEDYASCEYDEYFNTGNGINVRSVAYNTRWVNNWLLRKFSLTPLLALYC